MTSLTLRRLGFGPTDRVVVVHADDVGMFHEANIAFQEVLAFGLVSSGSVMTPCPWFPEVAAWAQTQPELDLGVHITLTSEWQAYRWAPVGAWDKSSGLVDQAGYFPATVEQLLANIRLDAAGRTRVQMEMRAQVDRAVESGIRPTHLDAHMYAASQEPLLASLLDLSWSLQIPALLDRNPRRQWPARAQLIEEWEERGMPVFDRVLGATWRGRPQDCVRAAKALIDSLAPGLTCLIVHPSRESSELRAVVPSWRCRLDDYEVLMSDDLRNHVRSSGVHVIGYKVLQNLLR
jgi:predicted glycoside hydrolase/deacetylase ChbG (UPF0249 family)